MSRATNIYQADLIQLLGSLTSGLAVAFSLVTFVQARQRFQDAGIEAEYGPSLWLGLVAFILAFTACVPLPATQPLPDSGYK